MQTAAWFSAIATFLAVLVALFKEEITKIWRRPILDGSIELRAPDCHKTEMTFFNQRSGEIFAKGDCYYFRIWVENKGNLRAERVQVYASSLLRKHADGSYKRVKNFLPMNLKWSHSKQRPEGPEIFAEGISPFMGKHCDLGHIVDPGVRKQTNQTLPDFPEEETLFVLDLEVFPSTLSHLIPPGEYRIDLKIAAANAKPVTKTFELNITGEWYENENKMFADGIGIKEI
jgi:hypothetical protein